ncbi:MAG TPA: hypothetical protein DCP78_15280 [Sphingobacterium sp.]|nr:hypothetical protein [Sphingobacterium sp.]
MKEFTLPKLPEGLQYGAEMTVQIPADGKFFAPDGFTIKSLDLENRTVVCAPIQQWNSELKTWVTIG